MSFLKLPPPPPPFQSLNRTSARTAMVRYCGTGLPISARANHHLHCTHYSFFSFTYTNGATSYTIQYLQECHFAASHCGVASQCTPHTTPLTLLLHVVALAYMCNHITDITPNTHTHTSIHISNNYGTSHTHIHITHTQPAPAMAPSHSH